MNLVPTAVTRTIARRGLLVRRNAPEVLFVAGVIGSIGSTVLACRATLKVSDVLSETQSDLEIAHSIPEEEYVKTGESRQKDLMLIRGKAAGKIVGLYTPAILLGAASVGCLTKSHNILQERNLAITAAYAAVDKAFNQYRERVVEKYGEEEDRELRFPLQEGLSTDTGETLELAVLSDAHEESMYARFFDEENRNWNTGDEYNLLFLKCQQNWANDKLRSRGHVFLNEVYDCVGLSRTAAGAVVGWVLNDGGDNYIDFGIFDEHGAFLTGINGRNGSILLDFNVDGVIWNKIDEEYKKPWQ